MAVWRTGPISYQQQCSLRESLHFCSSNTVELDLTVRGARTDGREEQLSQPQGCEYGSSADSSTSLLWGGTGAKVIPIPRILLPLSTSGSQGSCPLGHKLRRASSAPCQLTHSGEEPCTSPRWHCRAALRGCWGGLTQPLLYLEVAWMGADKGLCPLALHHL